MWSSSRLGAVNAALVSLYFAPVWATQSLRALRSPYSGFEDQAHAVAAAYFRALFDLRLDGLVTAANVLAGIKFVVAAAFVAYLIEFARALVVGRKPDPQTLDAALALAGAAIMLWAWPALRSGDAGLIRLLASELVLLIGATIVVAVERQIEFGSGRIARLLEHLGRLAERMIANRDAAIDRLLQDDLLDVFAIEAALHQRCAHVHAEFFPAANRHHGADDENTARAVV